MEVARACVCLIKISQIISRTRVRYAASILSNRRVSYLSTAVGYTEAMAEHLFHICVQTESTGKQAHNTIAWQVWSASCLA